MTLTVTNGVADRLAALFRQAGGADLPIRLRAWDGSETGPDAFGNAAVDVVRAH